MQSKVQEAAFAILFASFSLLLLSLFVFLDTTAKRSAEQTERVLRSLGTRFDRSEPAAPRGAQLPKSVLEGFGQDLQSAGLSTRLAPDSGTLVVRADQFFAADQVAARTLHAGTRFAARPDLRSLHLTLTVTGCGEQSRSPRFPAELDLAAARAAALFRFFVDFGLSPAGITAAAVLPDQDAAAAIRSCELEFRTSGPAKNAVRPQTVLATVE